jgi:hypothetical protein
MQGKRENTRKRIEKYYLFDLLLFILPANVFLPGGSGNTIRHNEQITHITQNNTKIK